MDSYCRTRTRPNLTWHHSCTTVTTPSPHEPKPSPPLPPDSGAGALLEGEGSGGEEEDEDVGFATCRSGSTFLVPTASADPYASLDAFGGSTVTEDDEKMKVVHAKSMVIV